MSLGSWSLVADLMAACTAHNRQTPWFGPHCVTFLRRTTQPRLVQDALRSETVPRPLSRRAAVSRSSARRRKFAGLLIAAAGLACLSACGPEAEFRLADESALPRWFRIPDGQIRSDVFVYYSLYGYNTGQTRMRLYDSRQRVVGDVSPKIEARVSKGQIGQPVTGDSTLDRYPGYTVLNLEGQREVVEHRRMEPVFYVVSEPSLKDAVLTAAAAQRASEAERK